MRSKASREASLPLGARTPELSEFTRCFGLALRCLLLAALLGFPMAEEARADLEKIAHICEEKLCFRWWPRVDPPSGWKHERDFSLHYNFNALAPVTSDFASSETVMYVNAVFRPTVPKEKTLKAFIQSDIRKFKADYPGLRVEETPPLKTAGGKVARVFLLKPTANGQWERVAYVEEPEYYIVFVASSRSESGLTTALPAQDDLVTRYRW